MKTFLILAALTLAACGETRLPTPEREGRDRPRSVSATQRTKEYAPGPGVSFTRNDDGTETVTYY
ncbi:hypothetical protein [Salipiger sp. PrR007]|uniref:hypothetical protein n=1 Tax=Salipiger sp. PrR007 TaxID=2706884 RepID=UPI0013B64B15|nr:hypothetical protein [Salipiger sp. PrR007]NDW31885.1 hypothetical protein [Salipiger sp. PrR007]